MVTQDLSVAEAASYTRLGGVLPSSTMQSLKLARHLLLETLRSRRFLLLVGIIMAAGTILSIVTFTYKHQYTSSVSAFYATLWAAGAPEVAVLSAVFFCGDSISGEFQRKTAYFLMSLPMGRTAVIAGKYIAALVASIAVVLIYLAFLLTNAIYYFGTNAFPGDLWISLVLTVFYLSAVLSTTLMLSAVFRNGTYSIALSAVLFLFGFSVLQALISGLIKMEPWMMLSYAQQSIGEVFSNSVNWGLTGSYSAVKSTSGLGLRVSTGVTYIPGIYESLLIMMCYLMLTTLAGIFLFRREEF